jgi:hypothetical protein
LGDKLLFLSSEIGSLFLDDKGKKLIFKTCFCDSEVNQCALSLDFWRVVRIGQLSVQVKIELGVKSKFLVTHLDDAGTTSLDDLTTIDWSD